MIAMHSRPVPTTTKDDSPAPSFAACLAAPDDPDARQRLLDALQREMRGCTRCVAAGLIPVAHPIFRGHARQRVMVVGQAPATFVAERPTPFSGASGKTLRAWFARAGVPLAEFDDRVYLTSLTKCFPGKSARGKGDRAPSAAEIRLCRDHLTREVALVRPAVVVTLGRVAATAFLGPAPLATLVGTRHETEFAGQHLVVIPLPHPSGVSHWLNDPANRSLVDCGLDLLAGEVRRLNCAPPRPRRGCSSPVSGEVGRGLGAGG